MIDLKALSSPLCWGKRWCENYGCDRNLEWDHHGSYLYEGLLGKMVQMTFDSRVDLRMLYSLQQETGNLL